MIIYRIKLKGTIANQLYVGKKNPYYCFVSDQTIKEDQKGFNKPKPSKLSILLSFCDAFLVSKKYAKLFTNPLHIKRLHTYCGGGTTGRSSQNETFSHYEVEIDDNGIISTVQLDQFVTNYKQYKIGE
jgi:hypothetical protein